MKFTPLLREKRNTKTESARFSEKEVKGWLTVGSGETLGDPRDGSPGRHSPKRLRRGSRQYTAPRGRRRLRTGPVPRPDRARGKQCDGAGPSALKGKRGGTAKLGPGVWQLRSRAKGLMPIRGALPIREGRRGNFSSVPRAPGRARSKSRGGGDGTERGDGIALLTGTESARVSTPKPTGGGKPGSFLQSKHFSFLPAAGSPGDWLTPPAAAPLPLLPPPAVTGAAALAAGERWGAACHSRALRSAPLSPARPRSRTGPPRLPSAGPSHSAGGGALPADPAPPSPPALGFLHHCYYFIFPPLPFGPVRQLGEPRRCPAAGICRVGGHRGASRRAHLRQLLLEICFPCYF